MQFRRILLAALALVPALFAAPSPLPIIEYGGEVNPGSYIIALKPNVDLTAHYAWLEPLLPGGSNAESTTSRITHRYDSEGIFKGYAGKFDSKTLALLRVSKDIKFISVVRT